MNTRNVKAKGCGSIITATVIVCLVVGLVLTGINLYGLTQPIRKPGLGVTDHDQLRFVPKTVWTYQKSLAAIEKLADEPSRLSLAEKANEVVNKSLVHVDWPRVDPAEYRQLVPVWENFFLYIGGRLLGLPEFERYHYASYKRNIRRGIGICGDASTVLSSVLDKYNIPNSIVSFDGHVIVEFEASPGQSLLLDPDFGVSLKVDLPTLRGNPYRVKRRYLDAGYSEEEINYLFSAYETDYTVFDDTYSFMTLRYLFEYMSYIMKWLLPMLLVIWAVIWLFCRRHGLLGKG